jgi:hypothetical protein
MEGSGSFSPELTDQHERAKVRRDVKIAMGLDPALESPADRVAEFLDKYEAALKVKSKELRSK